MAKFSIKLLPLTGIVILLSAVGFYLVKSEKEYTGDIIADMVDEAVPIEGPRIENFKVSLPDPDKGNIWLIEADRVFAKEKVDGVKVLDKFRLLYQSRDGFDFELEGSNGEYNSEKNEIYLSGDLKGKTSNGYMLYSEQLMIHMKENYIKSDKSVTFVGPFFKMRGKSLFIDLEKETFKILKDVNSTYEKESLIL